jgi:hypothetical protein
VDNLIDFLRSRYEPDDFVVRATSSYMSSCCIGSRGGRVAICGVHREFILLKVLQLDMEGEEWNFMLQMVCQYSRLLFCKNSLLLKFSLGKKRRIRVD